MLLALFHIVACADDQLETTDTFENRPPVLVTNPLVEVTPELLKKGIFGTVMVEVGIDTAGHADSVTVATRTLLLDSLLSEALLKATFIPAMEAGRAVAAIARFEVDLSPDSVVDKCMHGAPVFKGCVIDSAPYTLLPHARIRIHYVDTTADTMLTGRFADYLSLICRVANLPFDGTTITIVADSLGRFALALLPSGTITLSIQAAGYETSRFTCKLTNGNPVEKVFALSAIPERAQDSAYDITVHGHQILTDARVQIEDEERRIGITQNVSSLIQSKAEIRRVPEGPSMMLVRSGTPYDNTYVIAGIPMLAPFHFGGYPYADIDGLMISALQNVSVNIDGIAAKRIDASGCIVEALPGRIRYDFVPVAKGVYVKGDASITGIDLLGAYAGKNSHDYLQLGLTLSQEYSLEYLKRFYTSVSEGNYGIGVPATFANATLSGSKQAGRLTVATFVWGAADVYDTLKNLNRTLQGNSVNGNAEKFIPWGMASVRISSDSSGRSLTFGGAHQYFGSGNQYGTSLYETYSEIDNGELTLDFDTVRTSPCSMAFTLRLSRDVWRGWAREENGLYHSDGIQRQGEETGLHGNASIAKKYGLFATSLDMLVSAIRYEDDNQVIGDAGVSVTYEKEDFSAGVHMGRVSSRPDIRGLPDADFRKKIGHTYIASFPVFVRNRTFTRLSIEPYYRYCTSLPQLDPVRKIWDPSGSTPLTAFGVDLEARGNPASFAECYASLNLANAHRSNGESASMQYEWSLPWTVRSGVHLFDKKERLHLYVNYIISSGLPYYDFKEETYGELPRYRSLDLSFQYRTLFYNSVLKRLDCYFGFRNMMDLVERTNIRDYYWNSLGYRNAVYLGFGRVDLGLRFGVKL